MTEHDSRRYSVAVSKGWLAGGALPGWVPQDAAHYISHVELGHSLRQLAKQSGCHPSTILRQVRRLETRRDDPLVDSALRGLGRSVATRATDAKDRNVMNAEHRLSQPPTDDATLCREARRILRRLCESGAVLAVVPDMEKAVVARETADGSTRRTAVVDTEIAEAMALKEWISSKSTGRIARYQITAAGRAELSRLLAREESQIQKERNATGMAEAQTPFDPVGEALSANPVPRPRRRIRYSAAETPLSALARRRDKTGEPFLEDALVAAGERLREDFELSQMGPRVTQNWDAFLTGGVSLAAGEKLGNSAPMAARDRVAQALRDLGPGLGDVALRCCCYLEGLESAEQRMGWSARSGKIVLRIALQRLSRFYELSAGDGAMIG